MKAKDIMCSKPDFLSPNATLKEAAALMRQHDYGFIPIGENDRLIGTVTDRDLTIRGIAEGKDPNKTTVREIMSEGVEYCFEEDDIKEVANKMKANQIRRIIVLTKNKRMCGVISLGDIATKSRMRALSAELTDAVSQ